MNNKIIMIMLWKRYLKRKPYGWQVCEDGLLELWSQLWSPETARVMRLVSQL